MDPIASVPDGRVKVYRHSLPVRLSNWYGFFYLLYGIISRHLRSDLVPAGGELAPGHLLQEVADHARLRFPKGQSARRYNTLQKLAYLAVIFVLLPMIIATGLTMSPGFNAIAPFLLDLFGGRQSAVRCISSAPLASSPSSSCMW